MSKKHKSKNNAKSLLYGFHAVREAWLNPARKIKALYITEHALNGFESTLAQRQDIQRPQPTIIDKKEIDRLLPRGAVHQGLALDCSALEERTLKDLIVKAHDKTDSLFLILDQVTDPHNVGAIIRSAAAFGADGIILQTKHAPSLDGVLAKTACGGLEHLPIAHETNLSRAIEELKDNHYFVYGLDERGEDISTIKTGGKSGLVLGAEGPGLRRLVKENCDALLKIPMHGPLESVNVSNAAAIGLYAFASPRHPAA